MVNKDHLVSVGVVLEVKTIKNLRKPKTKSHQRIDTLLFYRVNKDAKNKNVKRPKATLAVDFRLPKDNINTIRRDVRTQKGGNLNW